MVKFYSVFLMVGLFLFFVGTMPTQGQGQPLQAVHHADLSLPDAYFIKP